jgi:two-component system sensor kinase FixL
MTKAMALRRLLTNPLLLAIAYIALYVLLDLVSYIMPVLPLGISPWNPPPGLTLFVLLVFGLRYWPAVPIACFAAEYVTRGLPSPLPLTFAAAWITICYTACAYVLHRVLTRRTEIQTLRDLAWFIGATLAASLACAVGYILVFTAFGELHWADFLSHSVRFWIGDLDGILVVTPLLLTLRQSRPRWPQPRRLAEISVQAVSLLAGLWLVFREPNIAQFQFFYILFLPLVWIVARHGLQGAVLSLAVTQIGLIAVVPDTEIYVVTFIRYQFLLFSLSTTALTLGVFVNERARADVTLQEQNALVSRTLQLAAAGELSSALAHELNQPITAVSNYIGASRLLLDTPDAVQTQRARLIDALDRALVEARRAGEVVQKLRTFFQQGNVTAERVVLPQLVQAVLRRLAPRCEKLGVALELRSEADLPPVMADTVQVEMVLHNILANALDAIEQAGKSRGIVSIAIAHAAASVELSIEDNGPGVSSEIVGRLFQPFTTSKPHGMGLGLTISRTLIEAHGGSLTYRAAVNGGSRFNLSLPSAERSNA